MKLVCVPPARARELWPHIEGLLAQAFALGIGDDTLETAREDMFVGGSLLWIAWDDLTIVAACATKLLQVPTKKLCVITACAGKGLDEWIGFIADIETYAKDEHCDALRVMGRPGWRRMLPGYREPFITLEKTL